MRAHGTMPIDAAEHREPESALRVLSVAESEPAARPVPAVVPSTLTMAKVVAFDGQSGVATVRVGNRETSARLLPAVDPVVVRRAQQCEEYVVVQDEGQGWIILGVLRTSATPGVDVGDDYVIEARRVKIRAEHELVLSAGMARLVVAALGRIESVAEFITSRAARVHKIIGRAIELN